MPRQTKFIAFLVAIVGALIFSLPDQACKLSGGRKLAEAAGVIVERSSTKVTQRASAQTQPQLHIIFLEKAAKKV
ncbi:MULTISPECIES: hypothetical protein [Cohaesibacter]|uniref:hypothetical protein n=1 Tax=Cohaesibacter TaxID=655352 RepID=UPI000DE9762F|nr:MULTISPECIES: hypothetical protein [Cohaesibacter]TLP48624.1 hypothetical protein FDK21_02885 [Cohaesibacter sp. CAU 1516]